MIKIKVLRLKKNVSLPYRATPGAVGFDICAAERAVIPAHGFGVVGTGIALEIPPGIEGQIRARSGWAFHHGIGILNSPGTIDPDYRGEIKVILFNISNQDFIIKPGDRIAQIVFAKNLAIELKECDTISGTKRGQQGFGHTG